MEDRSRTGVRERIWVTKFDHETDPPAPVEEVFIENGTVVSVTRTQQEKETQDERRTEEEG